ncbi:MAG TPA: glycosyltransferase [Gemmatimonadaceae bacterium]|jgi:glycosyltransferase involved in cell wall biosynthesis|nr:glycosyltransferase [Gemmatimonadaceae bacterium]
MRALFLTHSFPREPGDAAGSFVLKLAVALRDQGVDVHVVAPSGDDLPASDRFDGVPVERFRYAPRRYEKLAYAGNMHTQVRDSWSAKLALLGLLGAEFGSAVRARRAFEPDVVHAHWWFPGGLVGTWISGLSGVPLVTTLHGTDVRLARATAMARPLFRHVLQQSNAVTTVSRWLAQETENIVSGIRASVAPMPVATDLFAPGGTRDAKRLLFVGRLTAQKGIRALIEAVGIMRHRVQLDVVGDGPLADELATRVRELRIDDRVTWLGHLPQPKLVPLYQRATALVMPSTDEGLGLVAVEAQLCETPVVAYESGGLTDTIQHERTGLLVPPGNVAALAAALDGLLDRPDHGTDLGRAGRIVALAGFAPESAARRYAGIYRSVVGAPET